MNEFTAELDALLDRLDGIAAAQKPGDAIDAILVSPPRRTAVSSVRNHETVVRFRRELADGFIRVDTANRLLGLIRMVLNMAGPS